MKPDHTIIVDNFFSKPLVVRDIALGLNYFTSEHGLYSGKRTDSIHLSHRNFYDEVCNKILKYYSLSMKEYTATMYFHTTGKEFGQQGWVHQDGNTDLASIIYLNPIVDDLSSGTSLFNLKSSISNNNVSISSLRNSFIEGKDNLDEKNKHNSNYEKNVIVGGIFNRMIAYPGLSFHAGEGYFGTDILTSRLTLLSFFSKK